MRRLRRPNNPVAFPRPPALRELFALGRLLAIVPITIGMVSCASLDATGEIDEVERTIAARAGHTPDWSAPWDEISGAWDGVSPLSSDAAVVAALQNNHEIRQQVESIVATRADYVQAHLLPNPVISFALGFPIDGGGGTPMSAAVIQQLTWLWQRPARIDAATADLRRHVLAVSDSVLTLVRDVRTSHAEVVFAERAVKLQQRNCDLVRQSLELVEQRFDVGESTQLDVNRLRLDLLEARAELVDRENALAVAKRRLLQLLGRADDSVDWRTTGEIRPPSRAVEQWSEERLLTIANALRLDVAAAKARCLGAEHRLELAELGALPDVGAGARYEQNFMDREAAFPQVAVTPKLFDDNRARIARAASELESAKIEADRVLQQAQREVRAAWVDLASTVRSIDEYQQRMVELANENAQLAERAFTAGTTDLTVLLEAQRRQTGARLRLNDLQARASQRYHELERAAGGTLDPETIALLEAQHASANEHDSAQEQPPS